MRPTYQIDTASYSIIPVSKEESMTTGAAATIVYPETDGMPLPDGEYQAPLYVRIVSILLRRLRGE